MDEINKRFVLLRKELGLSQRNLGDSIGLSNSGISSIENGTRNVTNQHIKLLCSELNVNEEWLRTGKGEMIVENDSTIITELASEYHLDAIDQKIIELYLKLDDHTRKQLKEKVVSMAREIVRMEETTATTERSIDEEVENYRRELEAEKKTATLSASLVGKEELA